MNVTFLERERLGGQAGKRVEGVFANEHEIVDEIVCFEGCEILLVEIGSENFEGNVLL